MLKNGSVLVLCSFLYLATDLPFCSYFVVQNTINNLLRPNDQKRKRGTHQSSVTTKWHQRCMEALGTYYKIQPLLISFVQFLNMPLISSYNTLNLLQKSKLYNKMCLILSHSKSVGLEKQKQKISDSVIQLCPKQQQSGKKGQLRSAYLCLFVSSNVKLPCFC